MSRAFTLFEVLLSLVLLSAIAIALSGLLRSAAVSIPASLEPLAWRTAAEATLREIGRAIESRDRTHRVDRAISIDGNALSIGAPARAETTFRLEDRQLGVTFHGTSRLLLGDVRTVRWEHDTDAGVLAVTIESVGNETAVRSWSLVP